MTDTQTCTRCLKEKPLSEFHARNEATPKKTKSHCRACKNDQSAAYRAAGQVAPPMHKSQKRAAQRKRFEEWRKRQKEGDE